MQKKLSLLILVVFLFFMCSCSTVNKKDAEQWIRDCSLELTMVVEYLIGYEYDNIFIDKANGRMTLLLSGDVEIDNDDVVVAVKKLFSHGFKIISKNKKSNCIHFLKHTRFNDYGAGLAYSIDGINDPDLTYLTKLEKLTSPNWYYYEEDFNEWRIRQKQ